MMRTSGSRSVANSVAPTAGLVALDADMATHRAALATGVPDLVLNVTEAASPAAILESLCHLGDTACTQLGDIVSTPTSLLSRIRGSGPGTSFGAIVAKMEAGLPVRLQSPFEGSDFVAGAVWRPHQFGDSQRSDGLMKLRFAPSAVDLPLHAHEHSARFIMVLEGRGFHHISASPIDRFDGSDVRTVPIRERDVLLFSPGVIHTFSTDREALTLLSYHSPFVPLENPGQYTLPATIVLPRDLRHSQAYPACDPAWNVLAQR